MPKGTIGAAALAVCFALAGCMAPPAPLSVGDIAAVRELNAAYAAAWVAGDSEAVVGVFTEDAVLMPHHGDDPVAGAEAIRAHFFPPELQSYDVSELVSEPDEIGGEGNIAYVRGKFHLTMEFTMDDQTTPYANGGNYLMVCRRQPNGEWKIARFIWNDPIPQQ